MYFTRIAHFAVEKQTDTTRLQEVFKDLYPNVVVGFICTTENWRKDRHWIGKNGKDYYEIRIPFQEVFESEDATPMMLQYLNDRLQQIPPGTRKIRKVTARKQVTPVFESPNPA